MGGLQIIDRPFREVCVAAQFRSRCYASVVMIWRRLCEIFSSDGAERKIFKMLSWLLMPRPRPPTPVEIMLFPMMLKLPDPSIAIKELFCVGPFFICRGITT